MATPSLDPVIVKRQLQTSNGVTEIPVGVATYAEYVMIKEHGGTATQPLSTYLTNTQTKITQVTNKATEIEKKLPSITYGHEEPPTSGKEGQIYFKLKI